MKIKYLFIIFAASFGYSMSTAAQSNVQLGKVTYMEGNSQLVAGATTIAVKINTIVYGNQQIKTAPKSIVEIQWSNGAKTTVEPSSVYNVQDLFSQSSGQALAQSEGVFSGFKKIFREASESKRSEVGGIRRAKGDVDSITSPDKLYWKEDKEITFEEASTFYERGDYVKAVWAFKTFLDQKPMNEMAKYAMFALGHSYLKINNQTKAKELFELFISKYSNDDLRSQAESVLAKFVAAN